MFKVSPASLQTFTDTRLTLTPSVIPDSNYVIMVDDSNCLKYFCLFFCTVIIRCTEIFDHPLYFYFYFDHPLHFYFYFDHPLYFYFDHPLYFYFDHSLHFYFYFDHPLYFYFYFDHSLHFYFYFDHPLYFYFDHSLYFSIFVCNRSPMPGQEPIRMGTDEQLQMQFLYLGTVRRSEVSFQPGPFMDGNGFRMRGSTSLLLTVS
jgi:hypothetical protein